MRRDSRLRWVQRWTAGALLCCSLGVLACGGAPDAYDRVVVVTVSSLRWDHLTMNGYPRATTPFLDELAGGGASFERAYAASARAALSLATLLTGLEPLEHGLRSPDGRLGAETPTLAERFASRGYRTAAFVSHWPYFEPRGLDRGFSHFDSPPELAQYPYRAADRTVDAALAWLEQQGSADPLFLLLHLHDPARPFSPPPGYLTTVVEGNSGPDFFGYLEREHGVPLGWYGWEHSKLNAAFNQYDAELRFVDTELRRLREGLEVLGLLERTLFVVTAVHGIGLGNHFWDSAGQVLYEEQVRVPMIIAATDGSVAPRRIDDVVSHKDLLPTIFDLLDGDAAGEALAPAPSGRSLVPLLSGAGLEPRAAFLDRGESRPLSEAQERVLARAPIRPRAGSLLGIVDTRWKLLDYASADDELYDLENDPLELENLLAEGALEPPEANALREALAERSARASRAVPRAHRIGGPLPRDP